MGEGLVSNLRLDAAQLIQAARLIHSSLPGFYDRFPLEVSALHAAIAGQIGKKNSELEQGFAIIDAGTVVGIYTACLAGEMLNRQMLALLMLQKGLSRDEQKNMNDAIAAQWSRFSPPPADSWYLTRIAVHEQWRRQGIGGSLLQHFADSGGLPRLSLHVQSDNSSALRFYARHGFVVSDGDNLGISLLTRSRVYIPTSPSARTK